MCCDNFLLKKSGGYKTTGANTDQFYPNRYPSEHCHPIGYSRFISIAKYSAQKYRNPSGKASDCFVSQILFLADKI